MEVTSSVRLKDSKRVSARIADVEASTVWKSEHRFGDDSVRIVIPQRAGVARAEVGKGRAERIGMERAD
jgi:hypothetical protein